MHDKKKLAHTITLLQKQPTKGKAVADQPKGKGKGLPGLDAFGARDNAIKELQLLEKLLSDDPITALEDIKVLKNLSPARQIRYYHDAGDILKAEQLAKSASSKSEVVLLAVYVEMLHVTGKAKECAEAFERLRKISGAIDSLETPVFKRLAPIAVELKLPADWRVPTKFPSDFGKRPPLDSIGPLVWQPTLAPSWSLRDADGKPLSARDYAGKPTVVIFYLGYGCPHCLEQLRKFAEQQKAFSDAGISIVGISTDSADGLKRALNGDPAAKIPFPVASDPKHAVFKQFRAYDDFEQQPLHGTFLVDAKGLVRWHDIGYEPFMDTGFVLGEAKRLLALAGK